MFIIHLKYLYLILLILYLTVNRYMHIIEAGTKKSGHIYFLILVIKEELKNTFYSEKI